MYPLSSSTLLLAATGFSLQAAAINHVIVVGKDGLIFNPPDLKANLGDTLEFRFWAKNHSVVQGNWQTACQPHENGFFSGFVPQADVTKPNDQVFKVTLQDTDPKVFYCSQFNAAAGANHCKAGMVGVINGLGTRTFEIYKELAANVTSVGNPSGGVKGGSFEALQATTPTGTGTGTGTGSTANPTGGSQTGTGSGSTQTTSPAGSGAGTLGASLGALAAAGAFAVALAF